MSPTRRYYVILLLLVFLFSAPGLSFHPHWLSGATTNKGQFIRPPLVMNALNADSKWRLILWRPAACDASCMTQLDKLARIRVALGRRLYDVDLVLLMSANVSSISGAHAKILSEQSVSDVRLSASESDKMTPMYSKPMFFIANPDHYLVLAYQTSSQPDDLFHDIKLLLTKGTSN